MTIYFAGSIRGGRDDIDIYTTIIEQLSRYGEVMTEHIGSSSLTEMGESLADIEIYERDMEWLRKADVVVAEITQPSLGVGYEIGQAEAMGKQVLCLYRKVPDRNVSAMMSGNRNLQLKSYTNMSDIGNILESFFTAS